MATFYSPVAILNHLMTYLPRLTDRFSTNDLVSAEIVDGTPQVLKITDPLHGLIVGKPVVLANGKIDNKITAVQLNPDDSLRFTTLLPHDLTDNYTQTVELAGFTDSQFNGTFPFITAPDRNLFEIDGSTAPVLNGNEVLRYEYEIGINGLFTIDRIIDANIYEIDLIDKPVFEPQTVPILIRAKDFNIHICVNADTASSLYESKGIDKSVIYIIMGVSNVSKDRNLLSDAVQSNSPGTESRPKNINNFSLNIYFDTTNDIGAARASQLAYQDIYVLLLTVCSGIRFDDFEESNYVTTLINHEPDLFEKAFYSHMYVFEYLFEITANQQFLTNFLETTAFRDNSLSFNEQEEGSTVPLDGT